ncbi:MAG: hypothetical protein ACE15C_15555 [Phycisphaerae bacterium]
MTVVAKGKVQGRNILLDQSVPIPDGTSVVVSIETAEPSAGQSPAEDQAAWDEFTGLWGDREDMADSVKWVRNQREKWRQRVTDAL